MPIARPAPVLPFVQLPAWVALTWPVARAPSPPRTTDGSRQAGPPSTPSMLAPLVCTGSPRPLPRAASPCPPPCYRCRAHALHAAAARSSACRRLACPQPCTCHRVAAASPPRSPRTPPPSRLPLPAALFFLNFSIEVVCFFFPKSVVCNLSIS